MNLKPLYFVGMLVAAATLGACSGSTDSNAAAVGGQGGATASSTATGGATNTGSGGTSGASGSTSTYAVAACQAYCAIRTKTTGSCKMTQQACEEYSSCAIQNDNPAGFPNCAAVSKAYWECLIAQTEVCTAKEACTTQEAAVAAGCHD